MRRWLRLAALGLALIVLAGAGWVLVQVRKHPSLAAFEPLKLPAAAPAAGALRVRFAGVATLLFDDGETAWITDGFFSRPGVWPTLTQRIAPDGEAVTRELARLGVTRLAAVVPVHTHYDHALDSALVAVRTGAQLVGSSSAMQIGRGHGLPEAALREVRPGETLTLGRFRLTFIASRHSPTPLNDGVTPETIDAPLVPPARATDWRAGTVWSIVVEHEGRRLLVQGSAGFEPGALAAQRVDTVFLGIGTLGKKDLAYRDAYWREVVQASGARRVIPIHWDDFWRPLTEPLQVMPMLVDDVPTALADLQRRSAAAGVELRMPPTFEPFDPWPAR